jgi:hypothetical protein
MPIAQQRYRMTPNKTKINRNSQFFRIVSPEKADWKQNLKCNEEKWRS